MKIIALMPVKNEAWILPVTLPRLKMFCDEILCLDSGSTDGSVEIATSFGATVKKENKTETNFSSWRQELLEWGRERGGTHFIWLDADEAFTTIFEKDFCNILAEMRPGEKLALKWLCLWQSAYVYRQDKSVWSDLYKDFVFCDDGVSSFGDTALHEGRTPDVADPLPWKKIRPDQGAVLHFQFVAFRRFQIKQAYQRCRELVMNRGSSRRINQRYSATLPDEHAKVEKIPSDWLKDFPDLEYLKDAAPGWYYEAVLELFDEKGIKFFEPLEIWHIAEFNDFFRQKTKRLPRSKKYPDFIVRINDLKNYLKKRF